MVELTEEKIEKLKEYLATHHIPKGLGDEKKACSIAAINLVLTGRLTDEIPDCMSLVIGRWIISIQDSMPDEMRNNKEWKDLLPLAAGTGRSREKEFLALILNHMWTVTLPLLQGVADRGGFGEVWHTMCVGKTADAARIAAPRIAARIADAAADAARIADADAAADAARIADAAARIAARIADADAARIAAADAAPRIAAAAADPAPRIADAAARIADAATAAATATADARIADAAARIAARIADAAARIADADAAADAATADAAAADAWVQINPIGLLAKLVDHG